MIIYLQMIESDEDKSKFEQLYIMYKGLMFHVAMKILKNEFDAEDAVHQAFLSLIENLKKKSDVKCPKTRAYIVIITERKAIDIIRSRSKLVDMEFWESTYGIEIPCLVIMVWPMLWHDYRLPIVISYCCAIIMDTLYEKYHLCCI